MEAVSHTIAYLRTSLLSSAAWEGTICGKGRRYETDARTQIDSRTTAADSPAQRKRNAILAACDRYQANLEFKAQHGPVKIIFHDDKFDKKPVDE